MSCAEDLFDGLKETDFETLFRLLERDNFVIVYEGRDKEHDLNLLASSAAYEGWLSETQADELKRALERFSVSCSKKRDLEK